MLRYRKDLTAEYVRSRLDYDADSGELVWLPRQEVTAFDKRWNGKHAGAVAGRQHISGYIHIKIDGRAYKAHRIAWLHFYGEWPSIDLDHKDRNPVNNAIENLRIATDGQNNTNRKILRSNTSGIQGVCWHKANQKWTAHVSLDGAKTYLGSFPSKEDAAQAYLNAKMAHVSEFMPLHS